MNNETVYQFHFIMYKEQRIKKQSSENLVITVVILAVVAAMVGLYYLLNNVIQ